TISPENFHRALMNTFEQQNFDLALVERGLGHVTSFEQALWWGRQSCCLPSRAGAPSVRADGKTSFTHFLNGTRARTARRCNFIHLDGLHVLTSVHIVFNRIQPYSTTLILHTPAARETAREPPPAESLIPAGALRHRAGPRAE